MKKMSFDVEKVVILRIRGSQESVNLELSEEDSRRIYGDMFDQHGCATLKLGVTRGTGEKVCEELGIPPSMVTVIGDGKT